MEIMSEVMEEERENIEHQKDYMQQPIPYTNAIMERGMNESRFSMEDNNSMNPEVESTGNGKTIPESGRGEVGGGGGDDSETTPREHYDPSLRQILKYVGKDDGNKVPMKIVVVGPPGVGKSSFINSLAAAFSGETWREHSAVGSYGEEGKPITVYIDTFEKCGNPEKYKEYLLPTIIDIAGVENERNELWKELLKIVFFGRLPKWSSLYEAYKYGKKHGLEGLRDKFITKTEDLKADRVIFLTSASEEVPVSLINCVLDAARPEGGDSNIRNIPLYAVMTKYDKVESGEVPEETFKAREALFIRTMGLIGASHRYLKIYNYCDDVDPDNERLCTLRPEIDEKLFRFMTQVCDPLIKVINPQHTYRTKGENEGQAAVGQGAAATTAAAVGAAGVRHRREGQPNQADKQQEEERPKKKSLSIITQFIVLVFIVLLILIIYMAFVQFTSKQKNLPPKTSD